MVFRRGGPAPQALTRGRPGSRRCGAVVAADRQRPTEFLRVLGELEPEPIEVVVEATYGRGLVRGPAGRCRHPRAYGPSAGHQGDLGRPGHQRRRRGQDLAHLLRTNLLAEAWIAPPAACEARRLVHTRAGLVRMRSRVQAQLPALLADLGIIPELRTLFGPAGRRWLAELQLPATARGRLDAGLRLLDAISVEVGWADGDLRASFAGDDRVRRRLPIPGVGLVTAATVVAEVWDIQRFSSPARLCSWAGLTPGSAPATPIPAAATPAKQARAGGAGCWSRRPPPPSATPAGPLRRPDHPAPRAQDRPAPRAQDRPGGPGPAAAQPVRGRPARPRRLPCLPGQSPVAGGL